MRRVGVAFLAGDRGDVDDAAVILLDHRRHDRLAADEGPVEIDAQNLAPFIEVGFPYRLVDPGDAGIVDENVDSAERLEGGICRLFNRGQIRHVDLERRNPCAPPVTTAQRPSRSILFMFKLLYLSSFRDAPLGAGPESILPVVVMDSGLALRAPRNDNLGRSTRRALTPAAGYW